MNSNPFSLQDRTVLVTGASSGIGRSVAVECHKLGGTIIPVGRNEARLRQTLSLMDRTDLPAPNGDLTDDAYRTELVRGLPPLQGVVLNAGIMRIMTLRNMTDSIIEELFDVNVFSQIKLLRELFQQRKIQRGTSIVFTTSISGSVIGSKGNGLYTATKAALTGMAKSLALDYARKGIRCNCVAPGMVDTSGVTGTYELISEQGVQEDRNRYPLGDYGRPEDVAYAVIYLLSPASRWVTGTVLTLDGGFTAQ